MAGLTVIRCSNCDKYLTPSDRAACDRWGYTECSDCRWHEANGTRTIEKYNLWLAGKPWR